MLNNGIFEYVDKIKIIRYNFSKVFIAMKFKVEKIKQAEKEYNSLTSSQKELLDEDYAKVENEGLERVSTKKLKRIFMKFEQPNFARYILIKMVQ